MEPVRPSKASEKAQRFACPVCGASATLEDRHPEADLYRCPDCDHCASDPARMAQMEPYDAEYFEETHRNWFQNPDFGLFAAVSRYLAREQPETLLDVGCGNGALLRYLRVRHPGLALTGLDLVDNEPDPGIEYISGDFFTTDLDRQFDVVVSTGTIEHVIDVQGFLGRLKKVCSPGGQIIVMTMDERGVVYSVARLLRRLGVPLVFDRLYGRHHLNHFNRASLIRLFEVGGLRPRKILHSNPPLKAFDIPASGRFARTFLRGGLLGVLVLGRLLGRTFLQTVFASNQV